MSPPPISATFTRKKAKTLQDLSVPDSEYSDKSPKGSVDGGIRELIDEINAYEGFVTTSSCAGRISVFQEGNGVRREFEHGEHEVTRSSGVPGGKGGGKFLFVSHEPVDLEGDGGMRQLRKIVGQGDGFGDAGGGVSGSWVPGQRFVRFAFEPMILHVMTASLHHARPLLSAAINSGFRESGVQSLKNLDDPEACPMLAVRTAGLGLEAVIARVAKDADGEPDCFQYLVTEDYATMLLKISNERFEANKQRIEKFRAFLREAMALEAKKTRQDGGWESPEERRQRKRKEGLRVKEAAELNVSRNIKSEAQKPSEDDLGYLQPHPNS